MNFVENEGFWNFDVSLLQVPSDEDGEYDRALGRFMRNEIDYDEFMRLTGGQTIEEEMAADDGGL